jgi:hypothetical protein
LRSWLCAPQTESDIAKEEMKKLGCFARFARQNGNALARMWAMVKNRA